MVDNSTLPVDGGTEVFANDDISGVKYPRPKLSLGDAGTAVDAVGGAGNVGTNTLRVVEATNSTLNTAIAAIQTALQIMDDWDETNRAAVNPISGQVGVAAGAGSVSALTQRTTLASDDPAVTALQIMDDWDETNRAAVNIIAGQVGVAAGAGSVSALTQRATLASDDPAVASLAAIDDWDESDRAKVNPIAGQAGVAAGAGSVNALTQRTTLASDDPAVAVLGSTSGSAVITDANGTIQQYLRGLIKLSIDGVSGEYETVAASQTTQTLGANGATGDYLEAIVIIPATVSPGNVLIKDGGNSAITLFTGGTNSVADLSTIYVPLGLKSTNGAWQVTTGSNVSCIGIGNFT